MRPVKRKKRIKKNTISDKKQRWSSYDVSYLKKNHKDKTVEDIAKYLKRTPKAVRRKLENMNLRIVEEDYVPWTTKEIQVILDNIDKPMYESQHRLPDRTYSAIAQKRSEIKATF